jgi:hypothetical protein
MKFYIGVFIVENMLPREYFEHYLTYIIVKRLLTEEKIEEEELRINLLFFKYRKTPLLLPG